MSSRAPAPTTAARRLDVATLGLTRLLLVSVERAVYPFLPVVARGLGVSTGTASLLLTARALGGLTAPLTVATAGRGGRDRRLAVAALLLFGAGAVLAVTPGPFAVAAVGFAVLGAARPAFDAAAQGYIADRTPWARRARVLGALELVYAGGLLVGAPAAGWLIARAGWRAPFLAGALVSVPAALLVWRRLAVDRPPDAAPASAMALDRAALRVLAVALLLTTGAELSLVVFGVWLESVSTLSLVAVGGVSTIIGLAELTGESLTIGLADRIGKRRSVAAGLTLSSAGFLLLAANADLLGLGLAGFAVALAGFEVAVVSSIPILSEARPGARSRFLALGGVAMALGRATGATLAPLLYARGGMAANAIGSALVYALVLALLRSVPERPESGRAQPLTPPRRA